MSNRTKVKSGLFIPDTPRPDFNKPPVTEVVLGVQFSKLPKLDSLQMGGLSERFKKEYPHHKPMQRLDPKTEEFEPTERPTVQFSVVSEPPTPRYWFESNSRTELIQVQNDRFIFNWRQMEASAKYPRYEKVRAKFQKHFRTFRNFLKDRDLGDVVVNQCEVTYVNLLPAGSGWNHHGEIDQVFSSWSGRYTDNFLWRPEEVVLRTSYLLRDTQNEPVGRLHFAVEPRLRISDKLPMIRFTITARGMPLRKSEAGVIEFLNFGRDNIVRGFASFTTKKMHRLWERTDA
ncbi:MAG: TIGR04255 family protein [Nitrososphaera sp.]|nr:TIGR04255 family protein [Nitrososphaera sp.]